MGGLVERVFNGISCGMIASEGKGGIAWCPFFM